MILRLLLAGLHVLALGIGLGAVWARGRALRGVLDRPGLQRVLRADTWWGVAGALWLVTGLARLFGPLEKGSDYYLHNHAFLTKMALFVIIVILEVWAVRTIVGWRKAIGRGETPDTSAAGRLARVSTIQAVLVVVMVFLAVTMARGIGGM